MEPSIEGNQNQEDNQLAQTQVRRSGRCRTVNSIYADSIVQMKKNNKKPVPVKKVSHKASYAAEAQSDDYHARANTQKNIIENYQKAEIKCEDGSFKMIDVFIEAPKKYQRRSNRVIKPISQTKRVFPPAPIVKRKSSAFKVSMKEIPKEQPTSLLNIILSAAMKIQEQPHMNQEQQPEQPSNSMQFQRQPSMSIQQQQKKPFGSRQKIKLFQKDQSSKKLSKMQMKFENLKKRYQQIRPKIILSFIHS